MLQILKNKKMLSMAIIVVIIVILASVMITWNKTNGNNRNVTSPGDFPWLYPFIILNITGDRCEDGIEGNITDKIQVLEIIIALNTNLWTYSSDYENLEINFSDVRIDIYSYQTGYGYFSYFGVGNVSETYQIFEGTDGIWNNTTQTWDKEPVGNYTNITEKFGYGTELNPKNAGVFYSRYYFAYSLRDKDNSFDNGNRIYDKEDKHIMNEDDIIKIIINTGKVIVDDFSIKSNDKIAIRLPKYFNLTKHGIIGEQFPSRVYPRDEFDSSKYIVDGRYIYIYSYPYQLKKNWREMI